MDRIKVPLINIAGILALSIIGAVLMMRVDLGGTRWLKFVLYLAFFASMSSFSLLSSRYSCSNMLRRLRKRS